MNAFDRNHTALRVELARVAVATVALEERAAEVLAVLRRVLPYDAAWVAVRDPELRRRVLLATAGPAEPLRRYFETPEAEAEGEQLGLNRHRPPMLASEIPVPLGELHAWADHLLPAGFRGGLAAGLFTPGGRHVGSLGLLSENPTRPSPADREAVAAVTWIVADGLDRTREIAAAAQLVQAACAGVVLTRGGDTLPLPGLPGDRLLTPGSQIVTTAAQELADSDTYVTFLAPVTDDGGLVRITALNCTRTCLDHLRAAVLLSPPGELHGLTPLDLQVLGQLAGGATQAPPIAAALGVQRRAVADSLRRVPAALGAPDLPVATMQACRLGLRIPPQLAVPFGSTAH